MKNIRRVILLSSIFFIFSCQLLSQEKGQFRMGGYYSLMLTSGLENDAGEKIRIWEHYLNMNGKYELFKNFKTGVTFLYTHVNNKEVKNPFFNIGLTAEYNIVHFLDNYEINFLLGMSYGNLLFKNNELPIKKDVLNRVLGASIDFKLNKFLWFYTGYYNYFPLNSITGKYSIANPFLGTYVMF